MTYLEAVNKVLTKLRESTVTALTDPYPLLIGQLVNEALEDVQDAWDWHSLRNDISQAVASGDADSVYELTGTTQKTRILEVWNTTKMYQLSRISAHDLMMLQTTAPSQTGAPRHYCVTGTVDATGLLEVTLWPKADASYTIVFKTINPQAELSTTSTVILVPTRPVVEGAYLKAVVERGEDGGNLSETQEQAYRFALATAVASDIQRNEEEVTWLAV